MGVHFTSFPLRAIQSIINKKAEYKTEEGFFLHPSVFSVKPRKRPLNVFHINQAEPGVRNRRVTPVGLSSVLHLLECSQQLASHWQ